MRARIQNDAFMRIFIFLGSGEYEWDEWLTCALSFWLNSYIQDIFFSLPSQSTSWGSAVCVGVHGEWLWVRVSNVNVIGQILPDFFLAKWQQSVEYRALTFQFSRQSEPILWKPLETTNCADALKVGKSTRQKLTSKRNQQPFLGWLIEAAGSLEIRSLKNYAAKPISSIWKPLCECWLDKLWKRSFHSV